MQSNHDKQAYANLATMQLYALFHEIIDPLDEEWQIIFKNAYLVLKEIVDLNIGVIDSMPTKPAEEKEPAAPH